MHLLLLLAGVVAVTLLSLGMGEIPIRFADIPAILSSGEGVEYGGTDLHPNTQDTFGPGHRRQP